MFPWVTERVLGLPFYLWVYLLGFAFLCTAVVHTFLRQRGWTVGQCVGLGISLLAGVGLGGKAFDFFDNFSYYLAQPHLLLSWSGHGVNGGLLLAIGFASVYLVAIRKAVLPHLDVILFYTPIALAIGRVSCLVTADGDYGTPTRLPWGMTFRYGYFPTGVPVHPTPLYEIILMVLLFVFLKTTTYAKRRAGLTSASFLLFYSVQRFLMEFIRLNKRHALGLTLAQWICILFFLAALAIFYHAWRASRGRPAPSPEN